MIFNHEIILLKEVQRTNEIGDTITDYTQKTVLCGVESITRQEHYFASQTDLNPEITFVLNQYDYDGERYLSFEGKKYKVVRHYKNRQAKNIADLDHIELICEGVANDGDA